MTDQITSSALLSSMDYATPEEWSLRECLLDAEMRRMYYARLAGRFHTWDLAFKYILAVTTSGTVTAWAVFSDPTAYPYSVAMWKFLSGISTLIAIAMPILNLSKKVEWATALHYGYGKIFDSYEISWAQRKSLKGPQILKVVEAGKTKEQALAALESHFPKQDDNLVRECQNKIKHVRGITK
jgi:hypothetical protein